LQKYVLEIIVVDNNSDDQTKEVVQKFIGECSIEAKYVFEIKQGLSHARNTGVRVARSEILLFTDDDVIVDPDWICKMIEAFVLHGADCVGGKILPIWPCKKPSWLFKEIEVKLSLLDYGENLLVIKNEDRLFFGANIGFSRKILQKVGEFDTLLGRKGTKLYGSEDTDMLLRVLRSGGKMVYQPDAVIHHAVHVDRLKKRYFRKWYLDAGEGQGIRLLDYNHRNMIGIPLYIIREIIISCIKYLYKLKTFRNEIIFMQEMKLMYYLGFIRGRLKYKFSRQS